MDVHSAQNNSKKILIVSTYIAQQRMRLEVGRYYNYVPNFLDETFRKLT